MPLIEIPQIAIDKAVYYAAVIVVESVQLRGHMGDFFERRREGYQEACSDLIGGCGAGFVVMAHDEALERFTADPAEALEYLKAHHPDDFTTKRAVELEATA